MAKAIRVYLLNIETGQREIVGNFPGMTFAPRFSPDGQRVIMSLQQGGNANLFVMDLRSKQTTRLTDTPAIDSALLFAGWHAHLLRERSRRFTADHIMPAAGGQQAHQLRRGPPFDAGLVATRRLHCLHRPGAREFCHRRVKARRLGRAHAHGRLSQRRPDVCAQWTRSDVLPRRGSGPGALHDRYLRSQ